jgi:hypothetical protein
MSTTLVRSFLFLAVIALSQRAMAQCGGGNLVFRNFTCTCPGGYTVTITKCDGSDAQNCQQANGVLQPCGNNCYALQDTSCGGGGGITENFRKLKGFSDPTILSSITSKSACGGNERFLKWLEIRLQQKGSRTKGLQISNALAVRQNIFGESQ